MESETEGITNFEGREYICWGGGDSTSLHAILLYIIWIAHELCLHQMGTKHQFNWPSHLYILQKKALRVINFKERNAHSSPLFHHSKIVKIADKVKIENCLFMSKYTNNKLLSIFTNWFTFSSMSDIHQTSFASKGNLQIPTVQKTYGKNAFVYMVIKTWNDIQKEMNAVILNTFLLVILKSLLTEFYLNMYKTS